MKKSGYWLVLGICFLSLFLIFGYVSYTGFSLPIAVTVFVSISLSILSFAGFEIFRRFIYQGKAHPNKVVNPNLYAESSLLFFRKLLEANTEEEIVRTIFQAGIELLKADRASFVPYNEWRKSIPVMHFGGDQVQGFQNWTDQLSQVETRQVCKNCKALWGESSCILLINNSQKSQIRCFPIQSNGRDIGVINLYFDQATQISDEYLKVYNDIIESAGKALQNITERVTEISALLNLQTLNETKFDLPVMLNSLLVNVQRVLDVDLAIFYLPGGIAGSKNHEPRLLSLFKDNSQNTERIGPTLPIFDGIWKRILASGDSVTLENVHLDQQDVERKIFAVPLIWRNEDPVGILILGFHKDLPISKSHQVLLETMAGQAALLIQNAQLMIKIEYQAVLEERTRLAREIHDGLAQTLAFLKIQTGQMQNYLIKGEMEKLTSTLSANYRTLSDVYIDARQAIEDLRQVPTTNLAEWIGRIAADFQQTTNLSLKVVFDELVVEYPTNVQIQLVRIVQEALSNIRKHAGAKNVEIVGRYVGKYYQIEICDDGRGFTPLDGVLEENTGYGLTGMRERSESIGGDFQITSQPGSGTCVSLSLPLTIKEEI